jgi:RNA polymerase sigma factor (sigma-70 family)
MNKITKQQKDLYPAVYGYGSLEQLMADPSRFGDDPENPKTHWVYFKDRDGDIRFEPCTEDFFHWYRNENRNEERRNFREKERCPISIDQMREDHDFEFADNSYYENLEKEKEQEISDYMWDLIAKFSERDQQLLILYNSGLTDTEIGKELNRSQSAIQEKRVKLLKELKEKITKFQKNR